MIEQKAIYYGQVELIPGITCDGYVLDDETAVMSERGTADLLGVDQKLLNRVRTNWPPKVLKPFIDEGLGVRTNSVKVVAKNSERRVGRAKAKPTISLIHIQKKFDILK
ncbi:hypothetical protein [Candidatus Parabeggiatoa sp. HSG14]|uniref:hypothetical protein n=1 Tax=Candidatus Parabeggiatoa sp. HSG14 TaxID=3055593 RepID=UPI0025A78F80|nr:hypothetical protein [Thiotrichales bacterium HSG14]